MNTNSNGLAALINRLAEARVKAIMDSMLSGIESAEELAEQTETAPAMRVSTKVARPTVKVSGPALATQSVTRKRQTACHVGYHVQTLTTAKVTDLPVGDAYKVVLKAIAKSRKPSTEHSIIAATGAKSKTVQSAVWYARNHNAKGDRVAPGSRGALIVSGSL